MASADPCPRTGNGKVMQLPGGAPDLVDSPKRLRVLSVANVHSHLAVVKGEIDHKSKEDNGLPGGQ